MTTPNADSVCEHVTIRSHVPYDGLAQCCVCGRTVTQHRFEHTAQNDSSGAQS